MIGDKIRDLRKRIGITQEQLAGHELTKSYVSQVELGRIHPSRKALDIMANRLGKPLGYFFDNDDDRRTVDVLIQASAALVHTHRLDEALIGLKEAQVLAQRIGRDDMMAQIEALMGRVAMGRQDYPTAVNHLTSALSRLHSGDDPAQIVEVAAVLGEAAQAAGLFHEAIRYFNHSLDAARTSGNHMLHADVLVRYGDFCLEMGRWQSAQSLYQESERIGGERPGLNARLAACQTRLSPAENYFRLNGPLLHDLNALPPCRLRWRLTQQLVRALLAHNQYADAINLTDQAILQAQSHKGTHSGDWALILGAALDTARCAGDSRLRERYLALAEQHDDDPALNATKAHVWRIRAEFVDNLDQALEWLGKAAAILPHDRDLAIEQAVMAVRTGQPGALETLWELACDHPASADS